MTDLASKLPARLPEVFPGIAIAALIGAVAFGLHQLPHMNAVSPAILAAVIGLFLAHAVKLPDRAEAGIAFSSRSLLRWAVALLGLQVSFGQIVAIGWTGFAIVASGLAVSFVTIRALGRKLGVAPKLAELIAAGTSICGASAVAGVNAVTGAEDEDVAYAVAMVTLFGTAAMLLYPLIDHWLMLDARRYGLWAGASIHEVAQVVGATAQVGPAATQSGAIAKLTRVLMLAPLVMTLRFERRKAEAGNTGAAVPLFVIGFLALVAVNSLIALPHELTALAGQISGFLLAVALGAMGLKTHINGLKAKGWAPLALGAFGTVFISLFTLGLTLAFA
ncbi:YeiH family protein [Asticcacaulis taihuensis]|uniref:YeiH family protein n=1 Tax=Asticcacaulis taihuensis TaxID=260084 RepID=UPI0026EE63CB|nr:YeiH family protein [Asticcacaulis taihuensis]